jgi:glutamyl-Q tRNA(Asp) synthetase
MPGTPVLRFAPSPNGRLHLGHAYSALTGYHMARQLGGRFLLRIEDIDIGRCRPEYVEGIFEDLEWLGICWDVPVLRQSEHFEDYRRAAAQLESQGLLYPCFATRGEILAALAGAPQRLDPDGAPLYPGLHRTLTPDEVEARKERGEAFAFRIDMERALKAADAKLHGKPLVFSGIGSEGAIETILARPERWGDAVILRKDVPASYHLTVVVDDARQGVTHVTRGRDLFAATDLHRLLQVLLDLPEPFYHHHRLLTDDTGRKLAKSAQDTSIAALRDAGVTASEVLGMLGFATSAM